MLRRSCALMGWRDQGISYLKYLNVCTEALHMATKEKVRAKYVRYSTPNYVALKPDKAGSFDEIKKVPVKTSEY